METVKREGGGWRALSRRGEIGGKQIEHITGRGKEMLGGLDSKRAVARLAGINIFIRRGG